MTPEVWKPVAGYEGIYEVSDCGRVRSLDRVIETARCSRRIRGRVLSPKNNTGGYQQVSLFRDGKRKDYLVSRLVAEAFCEHPEGNDVVNHLDNTPSNNRASNLEWTTHLGNAQHSVRQHRRRVRPVVRSDGRTYAKLRQVAEDGFCPGVVCRCCRGQLNTHKGFTWKYANQIGDGIHTV